LIGVVEAVGVTTDANDKLVVFAADDDAKFNGGGTDVEFGLKDDKRFCADDFRRIAGLWVSVEKCDIFKSVRCRVIGIWEDSGTVSSNALDDKLKGILVLLESTCKES